MRFFEYGHLPEDLRAVSKPFSDLAHVLVEMLPSDPERTIALHKLREAKDRAVALAAHLLRVEAGLPREPGGPVAPEGDCAAFPPVDEVAHWRGVAEDASAAFKRARVHADELRVELDRGWCERMNAVRNTRRLDGDLLVRLIVGMCPGVLDREATRRVADEVVAAMARNGHTVLRGIDDDPWAPDGEADAPDTGECNLEPSLTGAEWVEWAVCAPNHPGGGSASPLYGGGGELVGDEGELAAKRFADRVPGAWVTCRRVAASGWSA